MAPRIVQTDSEEEQAADLYSEDEDELASNSSKGKGRAMSVDLEEEDQEDQLELSDSGDDTQSTSTLPTFQKNRKITAEQAAKAAMDLTNPASIVKVKLKLGTLSGPATRRKSAASTAKAPARRASAAGSAKRKRQEEEYNEDSEEDEEEEEEDDDSEMEEGYTSQGSSMSAMRKMTARQRAAKGATTAFDVANDGLLSLPMHGNKKEKPKLTAEEIALKKVADSRKRKQLVDKKLEEEKAETIDRLLKKQVGKSKGSSTARGSTAVSEAAGTPDTATPIFVPPTKLRWISSTKSGNFGISLSMPAGMEQSVLSSTTAKEPNYPGPRPPLKTRMLKVA